MSAIMPKAYRSCLDPPPCNKDKLCRGSLYIHDTVGTKENFLRIGTPPKGFDIVGDLERARGLSFTNGLIRPFCLSREIRASLRVSPLSRRVSANGP